MKQTPASPADNFSLLGGAVSAGDPTKSAAGDHNVVILSTPADEAPAVESSPAGDGAAEPILWRQQVARYLLGHLTRR